MKKKRTMKTCGTCQFADRCNVPALSNSTYICTHEATPKGAWENVKEWFCKCEHWKKKEKALP